MIGNNFIIIIILMNYLINAPLIGIQLNEQYECKLFIWLYILLYLLILVIPVVENVL